jgi:hypothetical protein
MKFLSIPEAAKAIKSIKGRAARLESDVHQVACSTLVHIRDHGDYTCAVNLMNAMTKGQRVKGLAAWYKNFTNGKFTLRQDKKQGNIWVGALAKDRTAEDFLIDEAVEITFADFTQEAEPKQMTEERLLKYLEGIASNEDVMPNGEPKVPEAVQQFATKLLLAAEALKAA